MRYLFRTLEPDGLPWYIYASQKEALCRRNDDDYDGGDGERLVTSMLAINVADSTSMTWRQCWAALSWRSTSAGGRRGVRLMRAEEAAVDTIRRRLMVSFVSAFPVFRGVTAVAAAENRRGGKA